MKLSLVRRSALALLAASALGLGMTGCGGGTVAFLWTIGQQYNQIAGFKMDDYTGNLTQIPHQPFSSAGTKPVSIVVKPGGRYVFVLNQGVQPAAGPTSGQWSGSGISVYSVGGDGVLTLQNTYQSQGFGSQWMQLDPTGQYLYVLDKYGPNGDGNGIITAFQVDSSSGRLFLQVNQTTTVGTSTPLYYFEVGSSTTLLPNPFMAKTAGNCLYVAAPTGIIAYTFNGGQLQVPTSGAVQTGVNITSINGNSTYLVATDAASNTVIPYSIGSGCALSSNSGIYPLAQYGTVKPTYSLIDNSNQYLYVLNNGQVNGTSALSTILAFRIVPGNSQLQYLSGAGYGAGAGATCMVEDPTSQYIYTSNYNDGTISGFVFDSTHGFLSPLTRGATFTATGQLACLTLSGNVS